jgi:transcriptional regulator with XRE-family HTH domain
MTFNQTLAAAREDRDWSPQDLATRLGVASETILRWESGNGPHTLHMLECWAESLNHRLTTELIS